MKTPQIQSQYSTGLSRPAHIEQAAHRRRQGPHATCSPCRTRARSRTSTRMGRSATRQLADLAGITTSQDEVLDAGSGIGGTARFLADHLRLPRHRHRPH